MRESRARPHRRAGLTPGQEKAFHLVAGLVVLVFLGAWSYAIALAAEGPLPARFAERLTANPLSPDAPPEAAVLTDLAIRALADVEVYRGESGALNVAVLEAGDSLRVADTLPGGASVEYLPMDSLAAALPEGEEPHAGTADAERPPAEPGIWSVLLRQGRSIYRLPDFSVITMIPSSRLEGGRIGRYLIGSWPARGQRPARFRGPAYDAPRGLIRVDRDDVDTRVSEHFALGDFLTKGQEDVWPKYVAMSVRLLDKLELTLQELERMGHPVENVGVVSGFRTPHYNEFGGSTGGRGTYSRHMYGDAMDFYIDNDRDGRMDDLNGDGRVDVEDARVIARAAERVERQYPNLVGGIGIYRPNPGAHSGFVHVDTRGYRARW